MIIAKFKLFENIARHLKSFLVQFQTDEPMAPFLRHRFEDIMRSLAWVILTDVMTKANTYASLIKVGFRSTSVHKCPEGVDVEVTANFEMLELVKKKEVNDIKCLKFKKDTVLLWSTLCAHMAEKPVLRVPSARHARCFIPSSSVENPSICGRRFSSLLEVLYNKDQIASSSNKDTKKEFTGLILNVMNQSRDNFS